MIFVGNSVDTGSLDANHQCGSNKWRSTRVPVVVHEWRARYTQESRRRKDKRLLGMQRDGELPALLAPTLLPLLQPYDNDIVNIIVNIFHIQRTSNPPTATTRFAQRHVNHRSWRSPPAHSPTSHDSVIQTNTEIRLTSSDECTNSHVHIRLTAACVQRGMIARSPACSRFVEDSPDRSAQSAQAQACIRFLPPTPQLSAKAGICMACMACMACMYDKPTATRSCILYPPTPCSRLLAHTSLKEWLGISIRPRQTPR